MSSKITKLPNKTKISTAISEITDKVEFLEARETVKMPIEEFLGMEEIPFQRDTESRANKASTKKILKKIIPEHLDVAIAELTQDCTYYGVDYKAGERWVINGCTRRYYWLNYVLGLVPASDNIPAYVYASIFKFNDMEEARASYDTFDSMDSVETTAEKMFGLITGSHNFFPKSEKVKKGALVSALNIASHFLAPTIFNQPTIKGNSKTKSSTEILSIQVNMYIEEIKAFDAACVTSASWHQSLIAMALMMLKKYGTNNSKLYEFFDLIDRRVMDTSQRERDGATHINYEWTSNEKFPSKGTGWQQLNDLISYSLYWAEKYMDDERQAQVGKNWQGYAKSFFNESTNLNSSLSNFFDVPENTLIAKMA